MVGYSARAGCAGLMLAVGWGRVAMLDALLELVARD